MRKIHLWRYVLIGALLASPAQAPAKHAYKKIAQKHIIQKQQAQKSQHKTGKSQVGVASFYAKKFHGRRTANGERFDNNGLTAAHLTLPFGTLVKVTRISTGKSVTVRINDRGPHVRGRIIDLTHAAAKKIGLVQAGTARVRVEVLKKA